MKPALLAPLSEAAFTRQVLALAKLHGWRAAHFRPGRTVRGWRTAVQGDGAGFPDLVLLRGTAMLVAELKVGNNRLSPEQSAWLAAFRAAGVRAYVWRPNAWDAIAAVLAAAGGPDPSGPAWRGGSSAFWRRSQARRGQ